MPTQKSIKYKIKKQVTCIDCGVLIWPGSKRCRKCQAATKPNWKGGISKKYRKCVDCGGPINNHHAKRCRKCSDINRSGSGHWNWQGGSSFEPYPLGWTKTFKEQIRYRDKYKCQVCGMPEVENGRKLDVHHIDYDKDNLNQFNLISLCKKCHLKTNSSREHWIIYFKNTMEEK